MGSEGFRVYGLRVQGFRVWVLGGGGVRVFGVTFRHPECGFRTAGFEVSNLRFAIHQAYNPTSAEKRYSDSKRRNIEPRGSMYPNSIYFGLKVVPI